MLSVRDGHLCINLNTKGGKSTALSVIQFFATWGSLPSGVIENLVHAIQNGEDFEVNDGAEVKDDA